MAVSNAHQSPSTVPRLRVGSRPRALSLVAALSMLVPVTSLAQDSTTATDSSVAQESTIGPIADRYLALTLAGDVDGAAALYAENVLFIDPTTDVFDFALSTGLEGPEAVAQVQRLWGIESMDMEVGTSFVSGQHALYYGPLAVSYLSGSEAGPMPFVTVLRIQEGLVTERTDFGDYVGFTERVARGDAGASAMSMVSVAREYMAAYGDLRFEDWRSSFGTSPVFQDPTLEFFQDGSDKAMVGPDAIIDWFETNTEPLLQFAISIEDAFFTPSHGVFLSSVHTRVDAEAMGGSGGPVDVTVPMVTALTFEDGKIVGHRDFWDVEGWIGAIQSQAGPPPEG